MSERMKRHDKMTVNDIEIIEKLMDANMNGAEISRITGRSDSGTQKYIAMIKQIRNGEPICCHPSSFNFDTVKAYAKKHGFPEPKNIHPVCVGETKEPEQPAILNADEQKAMMDMFHGLANDINFLAVRLHDIAEYIYEHMAKGGESK